MKNLSQDRTGTESSATYTFVGLAEIRASHETPDFMVQTSVEPHTDGTVRICEASHEGAAYVWGEDVSGAQIWIREDDAIARGAISKWENPGAGFDGLAQARLLSARAAEDASMSSTETFRASSKLRP